MIWEEIENLILKGTKKLFPKILFSDIALEMTKERKYGDFSSAIALKISKRIKSAPMEIAEKIVEKIEKSSNIKKVEISEPGFINFFLSDKYLEKGLFDVLKEREKYGSSVEGKGKTVVIDYSSPNIAKSFGVGHLRSTIIGQAIYNIYNFSGWNCVGDNHLGDWGTQFGKLIYQIKKNKLDEEVGNLTIEKLEELYIAFHREARDNPEMEEEGRKWFKKLESGDEEAKRIWKICYEISIKEFDRIYDILGIKIDYALGESFYENKLSSIIEEVKKSGLTKLSKGATIIEFSEEEKLPPIILVKSDGATTYFTRDLATIKYRIEKWNPELVIYEIGSDQSLYLKQLFRTIELLRWSEKIKLIHVAHGLVRWAHGKFSTRKGDTVHLEDVLNQSIEKAREIVNSSETSKGLSSEEKEKIAHIVGVGAVKYNDLSQHYSRDIVFDWEKMLDLKGNSGPYIQYTFARCKSIITKADFSESGEKTLNLKEIFETINETEEDILREIYKFPLIVKNARDNYSPNIICSFLFSLSQKYNLFYNSCRIIDAENEELKQFRLILTDVTAQVLENGLMLLGIEAPERM